ncbi:hypothetical protein RclHR1_03390002 [Rhizophagus clarus]|uniref:Uncharacterized protein n=1 Tax=Rhizophagus clarus TaxID=94130 RepID=A0A2Z6S3V5_9GLOM|nr:hypothetical protein RclHR1_03390002 [Rhizophagus clarus]GES85170.1 hypothetical protein GLOIN_2v1486148 [Rhizophagus clarus]
MPGIQEEQYQYLKELSSKITDDLYEELLKVHYETIEETGVNGSKEKEPEEEIIWITANPEINWEEMTVMWDEDFEEFLRQHTCQRCGVSAQVKNLENWENNGMKCEYCIMYIEAERISDIYEEENMKYERCNICNRKVMCYNKICKECDYYFIGKCEYCYKDQVKVIKIWELNSTCNIMKERCINNNHHAHDLCRECEYRHQKEQLKQKFYNNEERR